jgi:hypothetical protein
MSLKISSLGRIIHESPRWAVEAPDFSRGLEFRGKKGQPERRAFWQGDNWLAIN